jgi:nitroreductase
MNKNVMILFLVILAMGSVVAVLSMQPSPNNGSSNGASNGTSNGNGITNGTSNGSDPTPQLATVILEDAMSRRLSIRTFTEFSVSHEDIEAVLSNAYGITTPGRSVQSLCGEYPLVLYVTEGATAYRFDPSTHRLEFWKTGDFTRFPPGWLSAPCWVVVACDTAICSNIYRGYMEAGGVVQNIYLTANALELGTVCIGGSFDRVEAEAALGLAQVNQDVLLIMPLGYPASPYTNYTNLVGGSVPASIELPLIQASTTLLDDAIQFFAPSQEWSRDLTAQELSQILWAGYGYSYYHDAETNRTHRTIPSAHGVYPSTLYIASASGVMQYKPYQHTIEEYLTTDIRAAIASACSAPWLQSAPQVLIIAWQERPDRDFGLNYGNVEVGLIAQNVFLESYAQQVHVDWARVTNQTQLQTLLNLNDPTIHLNLVIGLGG